jgi:hypothetical protein
VLHGFGHVPIGPSRFLVVGNRGRFSRRTPNSIGEMGGRLSVVSLFLLQVLSKQSGLISGAQREKLSVIGTMHPGSQTTAEAISNGIAWVAQGKAGICDTADELSPHGEVIVGPDFPGGKLESCKAYVRQTCGDVPVRMAISGLP